MKKKLIMISIMMVFALTGCDEATVIPDTKIESTGKETEEPDPRNMSDEELAEYLDGGDASLYDESEYKGEGAVPLF